MLQKVGNSRRYEVVPEGLRAMVALVVLRHRVIPAPARSQWQADTPPKTSKHQPRRSPLRKPPRHHATPVHRPWSSGVASRSTRNFTCNPCKRLATLFNMAAPFECRSQIATHLPTDELQTRSLSTQTFTGSRFRSLTVQPIRGTEWFRYPGIVPYLKSGPRHLPLIDEVQLVSADFIRGNLLG
jgi:hypothetical protein